MSRFTSTNVDSLPPGAEVGNCEHCGSQFHRKRLNHLYCSTSCRVESHRVRTPCDGCGTHHRGPRCKPGRRAVSRTATFPAHTSDRLDELVPWGERSAFIAAAVEAALDRLAEREEAA